MYLVFISPNWDERGKYSAAHDCVGSISSLTVAEIEKIIHAYVIDDLMDYGYLSNREKCPMWEETLIISTVHVETLEKRASRVIISGAGRSIEFENTLYLADQMVDKPLPVIDASVIDT